MNTRKPNGVLYLFDLSSSELPIKYDKKNEKIAEDADEIIIKMIGIIAIVNHMNEKMMEVNEF